MTRVVATFDGVSHGPSARQRGMKSPLTVIPIPQPRERNLLLGKSRSLAPLAMPSSGLFSGVPLCPILVSDKPTYRQVNCETLNLGRDRGVLNRHGSFPSGRMHNWTRAAKIERSSAAKGQPAALSKRLKFPWDHGILLNEVIPVKRLTKGNAALCSAVHLFEIIGIEINAGLPGRFSQSVRRAQVEDRIGFHPKRISI